MNVLRNGLWIEALIFVLLYIFAARIVAFSLSLIVVFLLFWAYFVKLTITKQLSFAIVYIFSQAIFEESIEFLLYFMCCHGEFIIYPDTITWTIQNAIGCLKSRAELILVTGKVNISISYSYSPFRGMLVSVNIFFVVISLVST